MDINELREAVQKNLEERKGKQSELDEARAAMETVTKTVEERDSKKPTKDDEKAHAEAHERAKTAKAELDKLDEARSEIEQRIEDWEETERARTAAEESAKKYGGTETTKVRVGKEEDVYRKDGPHSFFGDMYRYKYDADPLAADRIVRHARQNELESRDVGSGSFAGLVIPQFLVDDFAPVARAGRPLANFIGGQSLPPDGMTFNVPRGNTGTLVNSQTGENAAVAEQDIDNSDVAVAVRTIAGQQDVSRQALDRGRNIDQMVMQDLAAAYAAELDRQIINGTGASGQHLGILSTTDVATVTVTSTDGVTQVRQVADAVQQIHSSRFMPATVVVAHPRRWAFWVQSTDSNGRPIVTPRGNGPQNVFGVGDLTMADGIVGDIYGLPVLVDPNIPTTLSNQSAGGEDGVVVTRASDLILWEDDPLPRRVRFEETLAGQLTVKIVAWDYTAFTAARYPSASVVLTGAGLVGPTFGS